MACCVTDTDLHCWDITIYESYRLCLDKPYTVISCIFERCGSQVRNGVLVDLCEHDSVYVQPALPSSCTSTFEILVPGTLTLQVYLADMVGSDTYLS